jgi:hypothetical protein
MAVTSAFRAFVNRIVNPDIRRAFEFLGGSTAFNDALSTTTGSISGNATVGGTLAVTGTSTLTGAASLVGGFQTTAQTVTPAADSGVGSVILPNTRNVTLAANTTDANDWFVLPAIATVPVGHTITIQAGAANCEMRTPATSNTTINGEDCDGTKEYLVTATDTVVVTKTGATSWIGVSYTALGAVRTAVVPD